MEMYIINPQYILRHETHKTYIMSDPNGLNQSIISVIHPIYAMMLSFFNNTEFDVAISQIASFFLIEEEKIRSNMVKLIKNQSLITSGNSIFPKNMIVEYEDGMNLHQIVE